MKLRDNVWMAIVVMAALILLVGPMAAEQKPVQKPPTAAGQAPAPPTATETIVITWPTDVKWVSDYVSSRAKGRSELFYPEGQSRTNWTEMVSTEAAYGRIPGDLTEVARIILMGTKQGCPDAMMEIIEKKPTGPGPATLTFELRCPKYLAEQPAEVQLWKMFTGKTGLYTLQYTYRGDKIPDDKRAQIITMLQGSKLVTEEPKE